MIEYVAQPDEGRHFSNERRVRLSDCGPDGNFRLDGVARYLQDVGTDDWDDVGANSTLTWVVRRTAVRLVEGGRWPTLGERVRLTTWCGGTGAAWAERRTNLAVNDCDVIETASLWVPVNPTGQPQRIPQSFLDLYGLAALGRKVSGRVERSVPPSDAPSRSWSLRRADIDVIDHVNNAAVWQAVHEVVGATLREAVLIFHGPVLVSDQVTMRTAPGRLWLTVDGDVRVSGEFTPPR